MKSELMYSYKDIMEVCKVGRTKAFRIVKEAGYELFKAGYRTIQGKVPAKYIEDNYK